MSGEEQDIALVRGELSGLKHIKERMAEDLGNPLPPSPEQIALRRAGKGFISTSFGGFQLTGIPELDEQGRESRKAELVTLDARIARAAALEAELVAKALEEKRYIFHAPGPVEGHTYCHLEIRALQKPDRCFSWAAGGTDWTSDDLTCSICRRGDTMGRAAGWKGPIMPNGRLFKPREEWGPPLRKWPADGEEIAPQVKIEPFRADAFPEMAAFDMQGAAVLVNDSDRAIVALKTIWAYIRTVDGRSRGLHISMEDGYQTPTIGISGPQPLTPVIAAHSRKLLMPSVRAKRIEGQDLTVSIDAVIFDDGEIVGPDTEDYGEEITARFISAREVASRVRAANATGKPLAAVSQEIAAEIAALPATFTPKRPGRVIHPVISMGEHMGRFQIPGGNPQLVEANLRHLETMRVPPAFYRAEKPAAPKEES
jgi:hypothetical protein